jgi:uncharacterized membrane protein
MARAYRRYRHWWRTLERQKPWVAGMATGASIALGYATGVLLFASTHDYSSAHAYVTRDGREVWAAVGAAISFVVGSVVCGFSNKRKASAANHAST